MFSSWWTMTMPAGVVFNVTEDTNSNFITTVEGLSDTALTADTDITFTNTRIVTVKFVKNVDDKGATTPSWSSLTVKYTVDGEQKSIDIPVANGTGEASISVPINTVISGISEADTTETSGGTAKVSEVYDTDVSSASITASAAENVVTIENVRKTYTITITKVLAGTGYDPDQEFEFTPTGALGTATFTLKNNESKVVANVPYGETFTVSETVNADQFVSAITYASGSVISIDSNNVYTVKGDIEIIFTNTIQTYPVSIVKVIDSLDPTDATKEFTVKFRYKYPSASEYTEVEYTIKQGTATPTLNLPYGSVYEVSEVLEDEDM